MKIILIGCGSIGKRHIGNLVDIGQKDILAFDVDANKLKEAKGIFAALKTSVKLEDLLRQKPAAAIIATPTALHIEYALAAARKNCHLFIEKPLSHNISGLNELNRAARAKKIIISVGYNFRFNHCLLKIKELLEKKAIGKIIAGRTHFGSYLPQRHTSGDYRLGYGAKKSLGGGVILDTISHHLDYMIYLLGCPKEVFCDARKASSLEIDVEDTADILLKFSGGEVISLHADSVQQPYKHTLELVGEKGTITCDFFKPEVKRYDIKRKKWIIYRGDSDLNAMYLREIRHFIKCLKQKADVPVNLKAAQYELGLLLKIKQSAKEKKWIKG